jgi:hypothetical protein
MAPLRHHVWPVALSFAACLLAPAASAGKLGKVWEVDLRKLVHATAGLPEFPVFALRFSPDGRTLAVIADIYDANHGKKSRLLLVANDGRTSHVREFEVPFGSQIDFGWSPSGKIVYAGGVVIRPASGNACELPEQSRFITDDVAICMRSVPPSGFASSTHVTFYDQGCKEQGTWSIPESWLISDISTDRGLVSVVRFSSTSPQVEGSLIVDPVARKVLQRWTDSWHWKFADFGKVVCRAGHVLDSDSAPAVCRSVDAGNVIGETRRNGAEPIMTAIHATRIVASDERRKKVPLDYEYRVVFKGRFVWDFGTGRELASWYPESQNYPAEFAGPGKRLTEPFRFALSPDGHYLAEGGEGKLRLYRIEP